MIRLAMAREEDVGLVLSFIRKLAEFEKLTHLVTATEEGPAGGAVRPPAGGGGGARV